MTPKEYQGLAERTETKDFANIIFRIDDNQLIRLIHASQGLTTEAGEFVDALKRHFFYGKDLDAVNLQEELGDIMWYVALGCNALGVSLESVMERNIEKLRVRYPEKFEEDKALCRDLPAERETLEK